MKKIIGSLSNDHNSLLLHFVREELGDGSFIVICAKVYKTLFAANAKKSTVTCMP